MIDIEFRSIDPKRNRRRFYRVIESRTLFGAPCLLISWGRIGKSVNRRTEHFADVSLLECRQREILAERHRNGYTVFSTTNHDDGESSMSTTPSERARHARAELEVIISALEVPELARLLELGRKLVDGHSTQDAARRTLDAA